MTRYDPRYVRMIAKFFYLDEIGNNVYKNIPVHNCTDKEWARFHQPDKETISYLDYIKGSNYIDEKEAFLCLDLSKDKSLLKPNYYSGLTLGYVPCD